MIANIFMAVGLGITIYYLVQDIPDVSTRPHFNASINTIPQFFSIVIFAMEAIGVVSVSVCVCVCVYTGCPKRNVPDFGRVFLMLKYTDITQNTYVQS
jgi:hypothetical protein